jgi:hypothetical protein
MTDAERIAQLTADLDAAETRLEEFHAILERKNLIIRLLSMSDLSTEELRLSDAGTVALLPQNHA